MNNDDDKKNLPAEQSPPREETRFSPADGDEKRSRGDCAPPGERSQTLDSASLLEIGDAPDENCAAIETESAQTDFTLPKAHRLRKPAEFQRVYKNGRRFDARFVSAFVLPNDSENHRLGITASRKAVGNAVQRNRAKRLLREAFRLSKIELQRLSTKYDFVLNARRSLLNIKMPEALADFQRVVGQISKYEAAAAAAALANSANNANPPDVNLSHE